MKCKRCRGPAAVELRRHNAAFCEDCFVRHVRGQVERTIRSFDMMRPDDRLLVAVSGGKDSLALWDVLLDLGYRAAGLYLGLGIGEYSDASAVKVRAFADERDAELIAVDLRDEYGYDIPTAGRKGSRSTCAVCGLSKRYVFNRAALEGGFDVLATGHNLDDEAANLLGNTLRWQTEYIARQYPVLTGRPGMAKKVKPKHAMNQLEAGSPGTKAQFFLGYLDRAAALFRPLDRAGDGLAPCRRCGQPTTGRFCAFCRARAQVLGERLAPPQERQVARELSEEVLPVEVYGGMTE